MIRWILMIASLSCAALVTATLFQMSEGFSAGILLLLLFDLSPLILVASIALLLGRTNNAPRTMPMPLRPALVAFAILVLAMTAWEYLDFLISQPTSSTSAIAFLFYPIFAVIAGTLSAIAAALVVHLSQRRKLNPVARRVVTG